MSSRRLPRFSGGCGRARRQRRGAALLRAQFLAWLLFSVVAFLSLLQFGLYREVVDWAFPRRQCTNVVGTIEPRGPVQRQVIVSGHHDSAYEFRYLRLSPYLYLGLGAWHSLAVYSMPLVLAGLLAAQKLGLVGLSRELLQALGLFAGIPALVFTTSFTRRAVPGAGDNLVSTGVALYLARVFRSRLGEDPEALAGTRLLLVSFDAEEAGLRGSRAFVKHHLAQLQSVPTVMLNLESFYKLKDLSVLTTDLNGFRPLSARLASSWMDEASKEGLTVRPRRLTYGLGATDAAELARVGVECTTLLGVPTSPFGQGHTVYHSREDVPENIEPEVVDAVARLTLRLVDRLAIEPAREKALAPGGSDRRRSRGRRCR